jgi:hypothetical protein
MKVQGHKRRPSNLDNFGGEGGHHKLMEEGKEHPAFLLSRI